MFQHLFRTVYCQSNRFARVGHFQPTRLKQLGLFNHKSAQYFFQNYARHLSFWDGKSTRQMPLSRSNSGKERFTHSRIRRTVHYMKYLTSFTILITFYELALYLRDRHIVFAKENPPTDATDKTENKLEPGLEIAGLPVYSLEQVSKHSDPKDASVGVWIVYKAGVYDVTNFVPVHPGGDNILLGAGNSIEPFWEVYGQHKTPETYELLESFRIGNLRKEDRLKPSDVHVDVQEYIPERNPGLIFHIQKPCNAEAPAEYLQDFLTPNKNFYIRNHLSVPEVDVQEYQLEIEGLTLSETHVFTLEQLKSLFPKHTVTSVIQCAGNRRASLNELREVKGLAWGVGAIGNAQWSGAKLCDVLAFCGANLVDPKIRHVQFEGLDLDATSTPYGASVPSDVALNPANEFVIAYEMNGEPIPPDHGFPVRLIAPGIVGARNVKWLGKIVLSDEESHSFWQRNDYKGFPPHKNSASPDEYAQAYSIQECPVQSAICTPAPGQKVPVQWKKFDDRTRPVIEASGYAWSGGGRDIVRVDVSIDDGKTWETAELEQETPKKPPYHTYSWTQWKVDLPLQTGQLYSGNHIEIQCRAFDSSYNTQPRKISEVWNFRGVLNNSWHRVKVQV